MFRSLLGLLRAIGEARFQHRPVKIFKKGVNILFFAGGTVVEEVRVLPHVERKDDRERDKVPLVLLTAKAREKLPARTTVRSGGFCRRVPIKYRPARAAHHG